MKNDALPNKESFGKMSKYHWMWYNENDTLPNENISVKCLNINQSGKMKNDTWPKNH